MTDFGATPLSDTTIGANQIPTSGVFVPGTPGGALTTMQGGPASTDGNGFASAPAAVYVPDGYDVALGSTTDASTVSTVIGRLTKIRDLLLATLTVAVSGSVTEANSAAIKADLDALSVAIGSASDAAWSGAGDGSEIAILKKIEALLAATLTVSVSNLPGTQPVSGTVTADAGSGTFTNQQSNIQADFDTGAGSQSMTIFGLALPASGGAAAGGTSGNPLRTDPTGTTTQPVSAASLPLPAGAATAAKQPALGTAGSAASDVLSVQGVVSMTPLKVDGSGVTQPVSGTFWQATQPVSGTVTANQGGTWTAQPGNTANTTPWLMQDVPAASGGAVPYHNLSAASTNFTNVKGAACQMYGLSLSNTSTSAIFVKFYDKATAPGTGDVPKRTVQVPANSTVVQTLPKGLKFAAGFGWAATGAVADNDNTAIAANCVIDFDLNS